MTAGHNAPVTHSGGGFRLTEDQIHSSPTSSSSGLVDLRSTGSSDGSTVLDASSLLGNIQKVIRDLQRSVLSTVSTLQQQL